MPNLSHVKTTDYHKDNELIKDGRSETLDAIAHVLSLKFVHPLYNSEYFIALFRHFIEGNLDGNRTSLQEVATRVKLWAGVPVLTPKPYGNPIAYQQTS